MKNLFRLVATILIIYVSIIILAYFMQTSMIFFPSDLSVNYTYRNDAEEVFLETSDNEKINGLFFAGSDKVILYFHGNAGSLGSWQYVYDSFREYGASFFIIDYRGFGKSTGRISEEGLYLDASAAYDYLLKRGFKESNIIVYGRSVGSGVAVQLASTQTVHALILESPFMSMKRLAWEKMPFLLPGLYIKYEFNSIARINQLKMPLLVIHGEEDSTIPYRHGKALFDAFSGKKEMVSIEGGGHNDLDEFDEFRVGIGKFLAAL